MTYYEELGLTPAASPEDIRQAHRIVAKLLHPDQHTDPALRLAAEAQMRRLNAMVDLLLDPEERLRYDRESVRPPAARPAEPASHHPTLGLLLAAAAALLLTLAGWSFLAGDWVGFSRPGPPAAKTPSPPFVPSNPTASAAPGNSRAPMPRRARRSIAAAQPPAPDSTPVSAPALEPPPAPPPSLPAVPLALPDSLPPAWADTGVAGLWVYRESAAPSNRPAVPLYAPEFIELRLQASGNFLSGQYASRYHVIDRAIWPGVAFTFQASPKDLTFPWMAADGTRGILDLRLLGPERLQVDWRVTEFGSRIGLGAGTAVLNRKREPQ